jgi:ribonuclease BN (tRNA processing enzyme)
MIEITFLGVGEAFDEELPNTSILIRSEVGTSAVTLLLDCGATAPPQFWKEELQVDVLDGIWISHFHGDHSLGLPALLLRFWEEQRSKALTILGQEGIDAFTRASLDLAYPGFYEKIEQLGFQMRFVEVEPDNEIEVFGLSLQAAENGHSQRDLGLRIDAQGKSIYYSGDGSPTPECVALAKGSQLIIHEAFHPETAFHGHTSATGAIEMAKQCGVPNLALVHIQRDERRRMANRMKQYKDLAGSLNIIIPEPGYRMRV